MGTKIFGPNHADPAQATTNNDLVVRDDGSMPVTAIQPVDQGLPAEDANAWPVRLIEGNVTLNATDIQIGAVEIKDGTTENRVKVMADGSINVNATATVAEFGSEGAVGEAVPTSAIQIGGELPSGLMGQLQLTDSGAVKVYSENVVSLQVQSEGAAGSTVPNYALQMAGKDDDDALRPIKVADDGTLQVSGVVVTSGTNTVTGTVTATQGTPVASYSDAWPMMVTDGLDIARVNTDGSLNVNVTGGTITAVSNTTANQGAPTSVLNAWPVKLTDGTTLLGTVDNPLQIKGDVTAPVYVSGTMTAVQGNTNGTPAQGWYTKVTDGTRTLGVNGDGSVNVAIVSGAITANNSQGTPNTAANAWPMKVTDGTNTLGVAATPFVVKIGDGTRAAAVNTNGGLNVNVVGGALTANTQVVQQGAGAESTSAWFVKVTDGTNMLGDETNPLRVQTVGTTATTVSGTVSTSVANTVSVQGVRTSAANSNQVTVDSSALVLATNSNRKKFILQNLSAQPVYVYFSDQAAGSTTFSIILQGGAAANDGKGGVYIDDTYTGPITAIAASGTGNKLAVVEM